MNRYSSSTASTAQSLFGRDNHLYAKIVVFARGMGHALRVYNTPHYCLRNTDIVATANMLVEGTAPNLVKTRSSISGVRAFRERLALRFGMANELVFCSSRSTLENVE